MRYLLEQFPSISLPDRQILESFGIMDSDQLLERASMPAARESLARQCGIPFEKLTRFAGLADLVRVKGIGPSLAEVFVDAGAGGNVQQLVERGSDPLDLRQTLVGYAKKNGKHVRIASSSQLREMCSEARELRPRLLLQTHQPDPKFRKDLFAQAWVERKHSLKLSLGMFAAILVPVLLLGVIAHFLALTWTEDFFSPYEDINRIYLSIEKIQIGLIDRSSWAMLSILLAFLFLMFLFYDVISYLQATWLVLFLFPTFSQQEFYKWINSIDLKKQLRALWAMVALLAVIAFILVAIAVDSLVNSAGDDWTLLFEIFPKIIIPGGVVMGIVASAPVLGFFIKETSVKRKYSLEHVQRYFVYYMSKVLMLPVMVVLLTQVAMPFSFSLHTKVMKTRFIPQARAQILDERQELKEMQSDDPDKLIWRDYALAVVDYSVLPDIQTRALVITPEDTSAIDMMIPSALNMVVWIALTALTLLFVVPYLILGGWGRGLFYMFILGISFALENALTISAPTWFSLSQDSIAQGPFIAFFVLINALFFDWLFDVATARKKICPSCKTELEQASLFCSDCGYEQG